jgi:hypothetical protein
VGPQPACNGKSILTGAAGSMTMVITFPKHFDPDKTPTGVDAGKWDWKQKTEKGIKKLIGVNKAPLNKISQEYQLKVKGKVKSTQGEVPTVILQFTHDEGKGISNGSKLNDSLTAGILVDEGVSPLEIPVLDTKIASQDNNDNEIRVFPNPSTQYITIDGMSAESVNLIRIYTVQGVKIWENKTSQSTARIDLQALPAGVYQILVTHDKGNQTYKKVVKE